jgi:hypothetical protein
MTEARTAIDIAKEIISEIRKVSSAVDESETDVYHIIMGLRRLAPLAPFKGYRRENTEYAAKLIEWVKKGQALLAASPQGAPPEVFFIDVPELGENRAIHFAAILNAMRERCEWVVQTKHGVHGNSGYQQERAAIIARGLMEKHGLPLAYSSPTSTYRKVARMFLEAMTEDASASAEDIERACEVVAKLPMMRSIDVFARL